MSHSTYYPILLQQVCALDFSKLYIKMGKCGKSRLCIFKCVIFNLMSGSDMVQTDLYLTKCGNTVTLMWCKFGGTAVTDQKSTTAQNKKIPCEFRPLCDQVFVIAGEDSGVESRVMKLTIKGTGEITFTFSLSGDESADFPVFDGSSVTWITFNDCNPCGCCSY